MNSKSSVIHLATDIDSYFEGEIQAIAGRQKIELSPFAVKYLGRMLARFSDTQTYLKTQGQHSTLGMLWLEGLTKTVNEQLQQFQTLGDIALFTSGFFGDRIQRSLVDMDYYMAMGGRAYERAGHLRESIQAERDVNIFFELAGTFEGLVGVLAEISDQTLLGNDRDVLKLYEKWLHTRSERVRRMLAESGIIAAGNTPVPGSSGSPSDGQN
ncbi:MAG: hypothetical protein JST16_17315 [Bdellovibrionales bacterium]|nr:hypothetical protein [Bdellovibrionales bacterium]